MCRSFCVSPEPSLRDSICVEMGSQLCRGIKARDLAITIYCLFSVRSEKINQNRMAALKSFIIISVCVGVALSYSTGAPKGACGNLTPQHGPVAPQKSAVPYNLGVSASSVNPGQSVRITVQGKDTFKGFLIQARDGRQVPIGRFQVLDQANSQLLECNSAGDSITHKKIDAGIQSVTFEWLAPRDFKGQVQFVGTVAKDGGTFWNTIKSNSVNVA